MGDSFGGHEMLNHLGQKICVTARTLRALDMHHYLRRDRASGLLQLKAELYPVWLELEPPSLELGRDFSGPNAVVCKCRECLEKESGIDPALADHVVREVRAKRKAAVVSQASWESNRGRS